KSDLLELHDRSLWESVFGTTHRKTICNVGGVLMFVGYVSLYGVLTITFIQGFNAGRLNHDFAMLVKTDEKDFMQAFVAADPSRGADGLIDTIRKLSSLETKARSLAERASGNPGLEPIIAKYNKAISAFRSAIEAMRSEGRMSASTEDKLNEAD